MDISARYLETGFILATIDGETLAIPDDMTNRHRRILAEWEAQGNIIKPSAANNTTEQV